MPTAEQHTENLNQLDATHLAIAKALSDAQGALTSKDAELARLKEEARKLEQSDPAVEEELDGTV